MRKVYTVVAAAALVLIGFVARDVMIMSSANAAVAGMGYEALRADEDFQRAVEWVVERCDVDQIFNRYEINC